MKINVKSILSRAEEYCAADPSVTQEEAVIGVVVMKIDEIHFMARENHAMLTALTADMEARKKRGFEEYEK